MKKDTVLKNTILFLLILIAGTTVACAFETG